MNREKVIQYKNVQFCCAYGNHMMVDNTAVIQKAILINEYLPEKFKINTSDNHYLFLVYDKFRDYIFRNYFDDSYNFKTSNSGMFYKHCEKNWKIKPDPKELFFFLSLFNFCDKNDEMFWSWDPVTRTDHDAADALERIFYKLYLGATCYMNTIHEHESWKIEWISNKIK